MHHPCFLIVIRPVLLFIAATALQAGCESGPQASSRLSLALGHYDAQQFNLAHQHAVEVARSPSATAAEREQAAYLAGLAAFRSGDMDEAELRLSALGTASDPRLLASSQALLGQIRLAQKRPAEAAALFDAATRGLDATDARQARRYAAVAHFEAGNHVAARQRHDFASEPSTLRGGFTLQVGAFSDPARADQAAAQAADIARRHGLEPTTIRQTTDSRGRPLFLVQFGHFPTRHAAAQARTSLGRLDYIVAPIPLG